MLSADTESCFIEAKSKQKQQLILIHIEVIAVTSLKFNSQETLYAARFFFFFFFFLHRLPFSHAFDTGMFHGSNKAFGGKYLNFDVLKLKY